MDTYTGYLDVTELAPPPKKETKLKCYDKTVEVRKTVTLEAKLEEAAPPYSNIKDGYVKFYVGDAYIGSDLTDADGKAYVDYTPGKAGAFTINTVFEATGDYNGSFCEGTLTVKESPVAVQKAVVVGSGGMLGYVKTKERVEKATFGADLTKLTMATMFANACKTTLSIAGEKVGELEAKYNAVETKTIDLKGGAGIPTGGKDLEIELKCEHVIGSGLKYAACATVAGV